MTVEAHRLDLVAARGERPGRFILYSELDLDARKDWLVRDLIGKGEAAVVYGEPSCGKSALLEDLALHIATGRQWFGHRVTQGPVLFLALERAAVVERRAIAWRLHHGEADAPFAIARGPLDFREPNCIHNLMSLIGHVRDKIGPPIAVIIDTTNRALGGGDENSPRDMGQLVGTIDKLQARADVAVLLTHHVPADGRERLRGHGSLLGAVDTTLYVEKIGGIRKASVRKSNDGPDDVVVAFDLLSVEIGVDDEGQSTSAPVLIAADPAKVPTSKNGKRWTRGLSLIRESFGSALADHGFDFRPISDGPVVKAVHLDDVRAVHRERYIHGGDGDRAEAERKAWQRNIKSARDHHLIGSGTVGERQAVWMT